MKQSKPYLIFVIICVALFAAGFYLRGLRKSTSTRHLRATAHKDDQKNNQFTLTQVKTPLAGVPPISATPALTAASAPEAASAKSEAEQQTDLDQSSDRRAFAKMVDDVKKSIPSNAHLREVAIKNLHETPVEIADAAMEMGRMSEALEKHPEFAPEAQLFYRDCSLNSAYPTSIRASCYADLQRQLKRQNLSRESFLRDGDVPAAVKNLAKKVL